VVSALASALHGLLLLTLVMGLGACQLAAAPAAERETLPRRVTATVGGEVFYLERIAVPRGGRLTVELLDVGPSDAALAPVPLGQTVLEDPGQPPYAFRIRYAVDAVQPGSRLALRATWRDAQGRVWFHTPQPTLVAPEQAGAMRVRMVRAGTAMDGEEGTGMRRQGDPSVAARHHTYQCGDLRVEARFDLDGGGREQVLLILPERDVWMKAVGSGQRARYAAGAEQFRLQGPEQARLNLNGQAQVDCERTALRSPWAVAQDAGAALRLVGHEPSWVAVLGAGRTPTLQVDRLGLPGWTVARMHGDGARWQGHTPDGQVVLQVEQQPCADAAVGTVFPLRATLRLPGQTLQGCGRWLQARAAR